jgi:hypothetical protein
MGVLWQNLAGVSPDSFSVEERGTLKKAQAHPSQRVGLEAFPDFGQ